MCLELEVLIMEVNAVYFSATTPYHTMARGRRGKVVHQNGYDYKPRAKDILPLSAVLCASLMSMYLIKKGNLDVGMRTLAII